jgi:glycerol-3-phosphate dehydrogenase
VLRGEVIHAIREEMAETLADVVLRRTGMGSESCPSDAQLTAAANCMAGELGWSEERTRQETLAVRETYAPLREPDRRSR